MINIVTTLTPVSPEIDVTGKAVVSLQTVITDSDPFITVATGTVNWGDGSPLVVIAKGGLPKTSNLTHGFVSGDFTITVTAYNYRAPVADSAVKTIQFHVQGLKVKEQNVGVVFGPILPRDNGFPNESQWNLNLSKDTEILESSVKMLLITSPGERVMEPTYGTNLRALLFEQNVPDLEGLIKDEIVRAIAMWEPRVQVVSVRVQGKERVATVDSILVSKIKNQEFQINLQFDSP